MRRVVWVLLGVAAGCGSSETPERLMDTGWFDDTGAFDAESCPHKLVTTEPYDGFGSWYWRDEPRGWVATDAPGAYDIALLRGEGVPVTDTVRWSEEGLSFVPELDGPLQPATDYTLRVRDCAEQHDVTFRTSAFGLPLAQPVSELVGRTYYLDLQNANWVEPGGVAGLLKLYFNTPVLIGVTLATSTAIDVMGGPGWVDPLTGMRQDLQQSTWDFPLADFTEQPWFGMTGGSISLVVDGAEIPVEQFGFEGTLSADMGQIGGGIIVGLVDTRHMGPLVNQPNNPAAICDLAGTLGVDCVDCVDGASYCLSMHARDVRGDWVPGLTLVPTP